MGAFYGWPPSEEVRFRTGVFSTRVCVSWKELWIPSGKPLHSYGKALFFMGKSTISMAIFNSYVDITRGYPHIFPWFSQTNRNKTSISSGYVRHKTMWNPPFWNWQSTSTSNPREIHGIHERWECTPTIKHELYKHIQNYSGFHGIYSGFNRIYGGFIGIYSSFIGIYSVFNGIYKLYKLVGGIPTPLKNMSSSVGMMTFPIYGKIIQMFQTRKPAYTKHTLYKTLQTVELLIPVVINLEWVPGICWFMTRWLGQLWLQVHLSSWYSSFGFIHDLQWWNCVIIRVWRHNRRSSHQEKTAWRGFLVSFCGTYEKHVLGSLSMDVSNRGALSIIWFWWATVDGCPVSNWFTLNVRWLKARKAIYDLGYLW